MKKRSRKPKLVSVRKRLSALEKILAKLRDKPQYTLTGTTHHALTSVRDAIDRLDTGIRIVESQGDE